MLLVAVITLRASEVPEQTIVLSASVHEYVCLCASSRNN